MTDSLYRNSHNPVTNDNRADWALEAIEAFRKVCKGSPIRSQNGLIKEGIIEAVGDLICDLMHLAERSNLDAMKLIQIGVGGYEQERRWPPDGFGPACDRIDVSVCVTIDHIAHGLAKPRPDAKHNTLLNIAHGNISGMQQFAIAGQWQDVVLLIQAEARKAIVSG